MEFKEINVPEGIVQQIDHEGPFAGITVDVGNVDYISPNVNLDVSYENTMEKLKLRIMRRLEVYLKLDIDGLRKFIINILLKVKKVTVDLLYQELNKKFKFPIKQLLQLWVIFIQSSVSCMRSKNLIKHLLYIP